MSKVTRSEITVVNHANGITLSAMVNGCLFSRLYQGYALSEAKTRFLKEANMPKGA